MVKQTSQVNPKAESLAHWGLAQEMFTTHFFLGRAWTSIISSLKSFVLHVFLNRTVFPLNVYQKEGNVKLYVYMKILYF